jgi:flagellar protein FlaF
MMQPGYAFAAASRAYGQAHRSVLGGRAVEAEAFARAASGLRGALEQSSDRAALVRALEFNQKLWTIVQAEASDASHPVPEDVRGDMLALARFMDRATADALAADRPRLETMIEINASLSSGFYGRPS